MNKVTLLIILGILIIFPEIYGKDMKSLKVLTYEQNEAAVREELSSAFWDIIDAPTLVNKENYLEVAILPNEIISRHECYAEIHITKKKGHLEIYAVPFTIHEGKRYQLRDFGVNHGVYLIIQGVAMSMNYPYEVADIRAKRFAGK